MTKAGTLAKCKRCGNAIKWHEVVWGGKWVHVLRLPIEGTSQTSQMQIIDKAKRRGCWADAEPMTPLEELMQDD